MRTKQLKPLSLLKNGRKNGQKYFLNILNENNMPKVSVIVSGLGWENGSDAVICDYVVQME